VLQSHGYRVETGIGEDWLEHRKSFKVGRVERIDLSLHVRKGCASPESTDKFPVVRVTLTQLLLLVGEGSRNPQHDTRIDKDELGRHDAHHRIELAVESNVTSECFLMAKQSTRGRVA